MSGRSIKVIPRAAQTMRSAQGKVFAATLKTVAVFSFALIHSACWNTLPNSSPSPSPSVSSTSSSTTTNKVASGGTIAPTPPPTQLALIGIQSVFKDECSPTFLLAARDASGAAVPLAASRNFTLSYLSEFGDDLSASAGFYISPTCTGTAVSSVTIVKGDAYVQLYMKPTLAGTAVIRAVDTSTTGALSTAYLRVSVSAYTSVTGKPKIASFTPREVNITGGGTLTISGTGFASSVEVLIGDQKCTLPTVNPAGTQITCTIRKGKQERKRF